MSEFSKLLESVRAGKKLQESDNFSVNGPTYNKWDKCYRISASWSPMDGVSISVYPKDKGFEYMVYNYRDQRFVKDPITRRNAITSVEMSDIPEFVYNILKKSYGISDIFILPDKNEVINSISSALSKLGNMASGKSDQMESNNTAPDNTAPDFVIENGSLIEYNGKESSVVIPDSVTSIGKGAFNGCSGLKSVTIPDSVKSIGGWAFLKCTGLSSIEIPDSVSSISDGAFETCYGLKSVTIGSSVTYLGWGAFKNCYGLRSITIPSSVTSISPETFKYCDSLTSIDIPNSVTSIGKDAFNGCTKLKNITYKGTIAEWKDINKWHGWNEEVPKSCKIHCTDGDI